MKQLNKLQTSQLPDIDSPDGEQRKQELEILLYQKVRNGEDVTPCLDALYYLNSTDTKLEQFQQMWTQVAQERSVFNSFQRVIITAFAILGMIAFLDQAFKSTRPQAFTNPPAAAEHR